MQIAYSRSPYARYSPTEGALMRGDIDAAMTRRLAVVRKSSRVGKRSALAGLGAIDWSDTLLNLGTKLVGSRISSLESERAAADARLAAAEAAERTRAASEAAAERARHDADAAAARSIATRQAEISATSATKPAWSKYAVPIGLGVAGLGAVYFLFMRKK